MKAIVQNAYGSPAVLGLKEIDKPVIKDDGVLVRVHAAALHAGDYFVMRGACAAARAQSTRVLQKPRLCSSRPTSRSSKPRPYPHRHSPNFTQGGQTYDLILDNVGNRSFSDCRRALTPKGIHVPNSGHAGMGYAVKALVRSAFVRQQGRPFLSVPNSKDWVVLKELIETGKVMPVIDRTYRLSETPEALGYVGAGHARGKVVITI